MSILKIFRHEYKYIISYQEMLLLRDKLNVLLDIDRNYNGYTVRSLYFDSLDDNDYYDKLNGEVNRKKIRLRIYDEKNDFVKLELKSKYDCNQLKESLIITKNDAQELINGNNNVLLNYSDDLAKRIYLNLIEGYYKPKVIISYNRIAYVGKTTTRITFDYEVKSSNSVEKFFSDDINYNEIIDEKNVILEVKFDRMLEPYIASILNKYISRRQSVSKYIIGRNGLL